MHVSNNAKIVDFAGWQMPVLYSGIIEEHNNTREKCGMFDIGHMGQIEINSISILQKLTTNDVSKLKEGRAQYSFLCNDNGGIIDDLLIYKIDGAYIVIANASNAETVLKTFKKEDKNISLSYETKTALAIQGPLSQEILSKITDHNLNEVKFRDIVKMKILNNDCLVSRSGYTGEDGFEIFLDNENVFALWQALLDAGAFPCGLGARDTLRVEASLPLYGHELDSCTSPLEAGLGRAVSFEKGDFIGRKALLMQQEKGISKRLIGISIEGKGIPRQGYKIISNEKQIGVVTSGTFSPTLKKSIGMAYVESEAVAALEIEIREQLIPIKEVPMPFYKRSRV